MPEQTTFRFYAPIAQTCPHGVPYRYICEECVAEMEDEVEGE